MNHNAQILGGAAMQSAGYALDKVPTPNLPIPNAMTTLNQYINEMGLLCESLANRLTSVLSPAYPTAESKSGAQLTAAAPPISPMVDDITMYCRRVQNIGAQVQDLLNRLEV